MAKLSAHERAELEAERDFLVRSLDDLEAERADGAIDDATYETLHSDYTARTADVLRTLASGTARRAPKPPPVPKGRRAVVVFAIVVFAGGAAFSLAKASGTRAPGGLPTGGVGTVAPDPNSYEGHIGAARRFRAESITDKATKEYLAAAKVRPKSAEPVTELAEMLLTRIATGLSNDSRLVTQAGQLLDRAIALDPKYAQAYLYKGLVFKAQGKPGSQSVALFRKYLALAPNGAQAEMARSLITQFTSPTTTSTTPPTTTSTTTSTATSTTP